MSLSYFTIFNPSLGPDEETLPNQLLFYTSAVVSDLDSQLRNIGLVQGIVELGRSFSATDAPPVNYIKSKDTRSYLLELEEGFWSILCLDVVSEDGIVTKDVPATNQVLLQMSNAYSLFRLEHGSLKDLLYIGRQEAVKILESWWMRWSWSWNTDCADAALLLNGYLQTRAKLTNAQIKEIADFRDRLSQVYPECFCDLLFMSGEEYLDAGMQLSTDLKQVLQLYLAQFDANVFEPSPATNWRDNMNAQASRAEDENSWLSGKRWTDETARLFGSLSFARRSIASATADEAVQDESQVYSWQFSTDKRLQFAASGETDSSLKFVNVLRYKDLSFILVLKVPGERERAIVREFVEANISHLAVSLSQVLTPGPAQPLFFSMMHDAKSGAVSSTLPSIRAAYRVCEQDSPLQVTVKSNTIHLHRQIYQLLAQPVRQSCIKTPKNIWILMKRDEAVTIVLAKSSKTGETMEEIEREGARWMTKLRKSMS